MNTDILKHSIKKTQTLVKFYRDKRITFDEFASNFILDLVREDTNAISHCLSVLSAGELNRFVEYAREYFSSNNFNPHPIAFMVDTGDSSEEERLRKEMKPKYEQLMKDLEMHSSQGDTSIT